MILRPLLFLSAIFSCLRLITSSPVSLPITLLSPLASIAAQSGLVPSAEAKAPPRANNELRGFAGISIVPCIHAA